MKSFFIHFLLFLSFLGLIYVYTPEEILRWEKIAKNPNELSNLLAYLLMFCFFYLNFYYLVPQFQIQKKWTIYLIINLLAFVFIFFLTKNIPWESFFGKLPPPPDFDTNLAHRPPPPSGKFDLGRLLILYLIGVFFSALLRNHQHRIELEKEKAETELMYLKAQINPHFLFNALNSIYSLTIEEKAKKSSNALMKLSNMMRYVVSDSHQIFVSLENELAYIRSFIDLQQIRFEETVEVIFLQKGEANGYKIAPLILISFIENAFKYGINPEKNAIIEIKIEIINRKLVLFVKNEKLRSQVEHHESTGLGIENTKKRLAILYPIKHELKIENTQKEYSVNLSLEL